MATLAQVALAPGPGENAWQVCGILPCIFWSTDELEEEQAFSLEVGIRESGGFPASSG